nr:hydantoinase B/oxoprolinase family protein [Gammaproteobacteria bacterium]
HSAGGIKFGSVEVAEVRFPLYFRRHELRPDSGGAGQFRGGAGCELELKLETTTAGVANTAGDGARHGACGLLGGDDGVPHRYELHSEGRATKTLPTKGEGIALQAGDLFVVRSGGGGGWGDPLARDPASIQSDMENGVITTSGIEEQ